MPQTATIEQLQQQLAASASADPAATSDQILALGEAYRAAVNKAATVRDYASCEKLLISWEKMLDTYEPQLSSLARGFQRFQLNQTGGDIWLTRGMNDYYLNADFIGSPRLFETAQGYYERAIRVLEQITIDPSNTNLVILRNETLALPRASLLDARGMMLFTQGEFELEAGGLARAQTLLTDAVAIMRSAVTARQAAGEAAALDISSMSFVDYAEAALHAAKSEQALLRGKLPEAAAAQTDRAEALERCQAMHARNSPALGNISSYFARRLAQQAYVARQRHDRLMAAAARQPSDAWPRAVAFVIISLGALASFVGWSWYTGSNLIENKFVLVVLLFYTFVVAGVGSRLAQWSEGAESLTRALPAFARGADKPAH